jgi:DNA-binding transcriptional MerR regulator
MDGERWTIDDLGIRVAEALASYGGNPSGRVRDVPDLRTIRYYTTLGLLERPAEMRGRTALYTRRHLLQLVAIKRLQAKGLALAEIQQALPGLGIDALEKIAQVPAETATLQRAQEAEGESARAFWKESPPELVSGGSAAPASAPVQAIQAVVLADDLVLLLMGEVRPLNNDDIQAIRTVAAPLLEHLHQRRLAGRAEKGPNHDQTAADFV